ncbi:MAG: alpha/beta hydrolase, partial [SAR324 cluster bacterium]|nr:alpha/beta hydrolase [SAR324 cluster bacterium]
MAADVRPFELPTTDGLLLRGEVWGGGDLALTFVHGSGLTVQSYYPAFRALAGRARVHALNSRGHGSSGNPAATSSVLMPVTRAKPAAAIMLETWKSPGSEM